MAALHKINAFEIQVFINTGQICRLPRVNVDFCKGLPTSPIPHQQLILVYIPHPVYTIQSIQADIGLLNYYRHSLIPPQQLILAELGQRVCGSTWNAQSEAELQNLQIVTQKARMHVDFSSLNKMIKKKKMNSASKAKHMSTTQHARKNLKQKLASEWNQSSTISLNKQQLNKHGPFFIHHKSKQTNR